GNVYVIDWYDKQACHTNDTRIWDRSNGRIYKICYRGTKSEPVDFRNKTDLELVELQMHPNDWYVRTARRLLMERDSKSYHVHLSLKKIAKHEDEIRRLRGLWALHVTGFLGEKECIEFFQEAS